MDSGGSKSLFVRSAEKMLEFGVPCGNVREYDRAKSAKICEAENTEITG